MNQVDDNALVQADATKSDLVHPWEDFDSIVRHANQARKSGDMVRAYAFFSRAVELKPDDTQGWIGWASTAQELDEAVLGWGRALALAPQDLHLRDSLHDAIVTKIELDGSDQAESFLVLGRRLAQMGLRHYAHQLLVRATELVPRSEEAWLWRGGTTEDTGETTMCLRRVLEINPENTQARAGLRWTAPKSTDISASVAPMDNVVQIMEDGRRAFSVGNQKRAYELFLRATELAPNDAQAWFWRGTIAADTDEAIHCMDQVLRINPEDAAARESRWYLRIRNLRAKGPQTAARKMVAEIIAPSPEEELVETNENDDAEEKTPSRQSAWLVGLGIGMLIVVVIIVLILAWFW